MQPGVSFSPLNMQPGQGQAGASPLQDAIKILSFRMPTTVGALGSAPQPTLPGSGGSPLAGVMGGGGTQDWLMNLFKGLAPADTGGTTFTNAQPPGIQPQAPPNPNVIFDQPPPENRVDIGPLGPPDAPTLTRPPDFRNWLMGGPQGMQGGMPGGPMGR